MITSAMLEKLLNIGWHDVGYRAGRVQPGRAPVSSQTERQVYLEKKQWHNDEDNEGTRDLSPLAKLFLCLWHHDRHANSACDYLA